MRDDLFWFAGFFDGEGTIAVGVVVQKKKYVTMTFSIQASNTHEPTIEDASRILDDFNIGHHIRWRKGTKRAQPLGVVEIWGLKRCLKFLTLFGPVLRTKRKQAAVMRKLIESRLERGRVPYSEEEVELAIECRELNSTRDARSPETIRRAFREGAEAMI